MKLKFLPKPTFSRLPFLSSVSKRYWTFVRQCSTPGVIPPDFPIVRPLLKAILLFWLVAQIGRIEVEGAENLKTQGSVIYTANHSSYFDALIVFFIMRRAAHYMTAHDQFAGIGGLRAIVMAACGAFPVDKSRGRTVIKPAIELVSAGNALVIFPEGRINSDGSYSEFKPGVGWIAMGAWDALNRIKRVATVPMHICYSVRDLDTAQGGYGRMAFKWRGGVRITVGEPIYLDEVPDVTPQKVTDMVRCWTVQQECPTAVPQPCLPPEQEMTAEAESPLFEIAENSRDQNSKAI